MEGRSESNQGETCPSAKDKLSNRPREDYPPVKLPPENKKERGEKAAISTVVKGQAGSGDTNAHGGHAAGPHPNG